MFWKRQRDCKFRRITEIKHLENTTKKHLRKRFGCQRSHSFQRMKYEIKTLGLKIPIVPKILRIDNMDFDLDVANKIMEAKKNDFK